MRVLKNISNWFLVITVGISSFALADQTTTYSPIFPGSELPFSIRVELADFSLPAGIQSYVLAKDKNRNRHVFITGRWNGMHTFNPDPNNFPANQQNTTVYVVDFDKQTVVSRSLLDPGSGLTQAQIDLLSVTAAQFSQVDETLYLVGGYGIDTLSGTFTTKDTLTAINVPGLIRWVTHPLSKRTLAKEIRTISDPIFRITGGFMKRMGKNLDLLVFGQDFEGTYFFGTHSQVYSQQVRRFKIRDNGKNLAVEILKSNPLIPDVIYRRRDLNVVPTLSLKHGKVVEGLVALSGVFTPPPDDGAWTVPVEITGKGVPSMADPTNPNTFKQGMNNYSSAVLGLFSRKTGDMYTILFGGISVGTFVNGIFTLPPPSGETLPFTNQITTVKIDRHGNFTQYKMDAEFPVVLSTISNPGNPLFFGADAEFIPLEDLPIYSNEVFKLDKLDFPVPIVLGHIVGGIQSTVDQTTTGSDSAASPYIFRVILDPISSDSSSSCCCH